MSRKVRKPKTDNGPEDDPPRSAGIRDDGARNTFIDCEVSGYDVGFDLRGEDATLIRPVVNGRRLTSDDLANQAVQGAAATRRSWLVGRVPWHDKRDQTSSSDDDSPSS